MISGRKKELLLLNNAANDDQSHFIAVYGRRRIGKTFLVREAFGYRFTFQHAGLSAGGMKAQLHAFTSSLRDTGFYVKKTPSCWLEAFDLLKDLIRHSTEKRKILFIDELSWMDTQKSDLMVALENFWNGWASGRKDIVLIICCSSTSWMLSKVIHNKGGLYNRLTEQINLQPFSLAECEAFTSAKNIALTRIQLLQYYMVFGGVPYYWEFLQKGLSVQQNIDNILFSSDAPLKHEYEYLYSSIFKNPDVYIKIVEALGKKKSGMTRDELIKSTALTNSGGLTTKLEELEKCGFIRKYYAYGKKRKNAVYQLVDFFSLFYLSFMGATQSDEHFWSNQINTPSVNTWLGLSFERVCMEHISQIKDRLGISGVSTEVNSWYCTPSPENGIGGTQIDMLIVRKDGIINLCEMKYSSTEYTITEKTDMEIKRKLHNFILATETKFAVFPTLITTYGLVENAYANDIQAVITLNDLFALPQNRS